MDQERREAIRYTALKVTNKILARKVPDVNITLKPPRTLAREHYSEVFVAIFNGKMA